MAPIAIDRGHVCIYRPCSSREHDVIPDRGAPRIGPVSRTPPQIREIRDAEFSQLEAVENDADTLLVEELLPHRWSPAPPGIERRGHAGVILVAESSASDAEYRHQNIEGFIDVRYFGTTAYIDTLAVRRSAMRKGVGRHLLLTAVDRAASDHCSEATLRTYSSLAFNAPFYASAGFEEFRPPHDAQWAHHVIQDEKAADLPRISDRIFMKCRLGSPT